MTLSKKDTLRPEKSNMYARQVRKTAIGITIILFLVCCYFHDSLSQTNEIRLWVFVSSSELVQSDSALSALIQEFEEAKQVSVAVTRIDWRDALSALQMAAYAETDELFLPDIVQMPSTFMARFADMGALVEVGRHHLNGYYLRSTQTCKIESKDEVYAIPWYIDSRLLFYEKIKGSEGENIIGDPLTSFFDWDSFLNTCVRIKAALEKAESAEKNRPVFALPTERDFDLLHQLSVLVFSYGGDIVKRKHRWLECVLDGPGGRSASRLLHNLFEAGCLSLPEMNRDALERSFTSGQGPVVMMSGPWLAKRLEDAHGPDWRKRFGVALVPKGPSGEYHTFLGGSHLAVFKAAPRRGNYEKALDLIQFMTQSKAALSYILAKGQIPAHKGLLEKYGAIEQENKVFVQSFAHGRSYPSSPLWASVMDQATALEYLSAYWNSISKGDTSLTASNLSATDRIIDEQLYNRPRNEFATKLLLAILVLTLAVVSLFAVKQWRLKRRLEKQDRAFLKYQQQLMSQLTSYRTTANDTSESSLGE